MDDDGGDDTLIVMNHGEAHATGGANTNEVFFTPNGGSSVVVLEEDDNPVPAQPIPPFRPPPQPRAPAAGHNNFAGPVGHNAGPQTKAVLPEDDLLRYVDLDSLANPERAKKAPPAAGPGGTGAGGMAGTAGAGRKKPEPEEPDRPVPARFPPAPKRRQTADRAPADRAPADRPGPPAERRRPPEPRTSEPTRREEPIVERQEPEMRPTVPAGTGPEAPSPWNSDYQVQGSQPEVYGFGGGGGYESVETSYYDNPYQDLPPQAAHAPRHPEGQAAPPQQHQRPSGPAGAPGNRRPPNRPGAASGVGQGGQAQGPQRPDQQRGAGERRSAAVPPEEMRRRREEEERKEKMQLLHKLYNYEQRGHRMANSYSMDSNIDELRFEVSKIRNEESAKHSVKWYKVFLMIMVSTVEALNTRFDPFGLRLKGWSKDMNEKKDDLDDCFHRLHDKYSSKTAIEPELELAFAFFGGCFMYHLQNAAESYGELGNMMSAITGGGAPARKPAAAPRAPQQQQVMTNMPLFNQPDYNQQPSYSAPQQPQFVQQPQQQQAQQQPRVGKSGRRIMNAPPIPGGQTGIDVMSMMAGASASEPPDLPPNVMDVPIQVGGYATAVSSPVRNEQPAAPRNSEPAAPPRSSPAPPSSRTISSQPARSAPPPPRSSDGARPRRGGGASAPANGSTPKREGRGIQI